MSEENEDTATDEASSAPQAQPAAQEPAAAEDTESEAAQVSPDEAASLETAEDIAKSLSGKDVNIDALLKVPVSLSIEVGRTKMTLTELLNTQEGSIIELERLLDEPLDIRVNGALIAHGVVVLADERFGLQITDIISLEERARSL
jgi:flagellar motor switch protein FliN/FliY